MKRSKILLATTTAILAVAGVFAAKAHQFSTLHPGFYSAGPGGEEATGCTVLLLNQYYTDPGSNTAIPGFTEYNPNGCTGKPLFVSHGNN